MQLLGRSDYSPYTTPIPRRDDDVVRKALKIWGAAHTAQGTIVSKYLASRAILLDPWPPSLRFHAKCPRPRDSGGNLQRPLPAMVALVEHVEHGPVGVHCTYLRLDGSGKADLPKNEQRACFGRLQGGAVRFGASTPGVWLVVGEGIESALSAALPCNLPSWAALSASGIENLLLPLDATHVVIAADNDLNGRGQSAAQRRAADWLAESRHVRLALPPLNSDFNDVLTGKATTEIHEVHHVGV